MQDSLFDETRYAPNTKLYMLFYRESRRDDLYHTMIMIQDLTLFTVEESRLVCSRYTSSLSRPLLSLQISDDSSVLASLDFCATEMFSRVPSCWQYHRHVAGSSRAATSLPMLQQIQQLTRLIYNSAKQGPHLDNLVRQYHQRTCCTKDKIVCIFLGNGNAYFWQFHSTTACLSTACLLPEPLSVCQLPLPR